MDSGISSNIFDNDSLDISGSILNNNKVSDLSTTDAVVSIRPPVGKKMKKS